MLITLAMICLVLSSSFASAADSADEPRNLGEIVSMRDASTKVYQLSDGRLRYEIYATRIHYKDEKGDWADIDETVQPATGDAASKGYQYENGANDWNAYFAAQGSPASMVMIARGEQFIEFTMVSEQKASTLSKAADLPTGVSSVQDSYAENDCAVMYINMMPDVDLVYTVGADSLKEDIILNRYTGAALTFRLKATGLTVAEKDGIIDFNDEATGETVFETGRLCMEDANGKYSEDLEMRITQVGDEYELTILPDSAFLSDPDTAYPVVVDPTVYFALGSSTPDSFIACQNPTPSGGACGTCGMCTRNFNSGTNMAYLRTGKDTSYGVRRSFIQFSLPTITGTVDEAYLELRRSSYSGSPAIRAYRVYQYWTSSSIKWNNKPEYTTTLASDVAVSFEPNWYRMDVSGIVYEWYHQGYPNYGFCVRDNTENNTNHWTTWCSSDYSTGYYKPRLVIITGTPSAYAVGKDLAPDQDYYYEACVANAYAGGIGYSSSVTDNTYPSTVCNLLCEKAVVAICGHGYAGNGYGGAMAIYHYDPLSFDYLSAKTNSPGFPFSLESVYNSGNKTLDALRFILYQGCYTGRTNTEYSLGNLPQQRQCTVRIVP